VNVEIPPLAERRQDIPLLVRHFADGFGVAEIPEDVIRHFSERAWPGNVRELKNALEAWLTVGSLNRPMRSSTASVEEALKAYIDPSRPYAEQKEAFLEKFVRVYVELLLTHAKGNQSEAARISGLQRSYLGKIVRKLQSRDN